MQFSEKKVGVNFFYGVELVHVQPFGNHSLVCVRTKNAFTLVGKYKSYGAHCVGGSRVACYTAKNDSGCSEMLGNEVQCNAM